MIVLIAVTYTEELPKSCKMLKEKCNLCGTVDFIARCRMKTVEQKCMNGRSFNKMIKLNWLLEKMDRKEQMRKRIDQFWIQEETGPSYYVDG